MRHRPDQATAGTLAQVLGQSLVELVAAGTTPDSRIDGVAILGAGRSSGTGLLALAPGQDPRQAVETAAALGYAAVVTDISGDIDSIRSAVRRAGPTVLLRQPDVDWLTLADAARELLRRRPVDPGAESPTSVPAGDLRALAESLGTFVEGPVIVEDIDFRVLAFSTEREEVDRGRDSAILGGRIPEAWLEHLERVGALEALLNSDQVVDVRNGPFQARRRLLKAIRADRRPLGILWVAEGSRPLPDDIVERTEQAADLAAPHLLRYLNESYDRRTAERRVLRRLLESGDLTRSELEDLGVAPADRYALLALRAKRARGNDGELPAGLVESVDLYCQSYRWRVSTVAVGATVYCVLALSGERGDRDVVALAEGLASHARQSQRTEISLAVAGPQERAEQIPSLRGQADEVLEVLARQGGAITVVRHHRDAVPLIGLRQVATLAAAEDFREYYKLKLLREHDSRSGTHYISTLLTYLRAGGDSTAAAGRLGLHPTTLRYRLRRLAELAGLDLNDPSERLYCEIALLDSDLR